MAEAGVTPPAHMGQLSVLVIDPKSSSRTATTKLLEDNGYKVRKNTFPSISQKLIYAGHLCVPLFP
jgi:response regulator RpfG family c-di-GMP phosphodiesterase